MQAKITQVLEDTGLVHAPIHGHFCWVDNHGINELYIQGDIHDRDAVAIAVAETLHQNEIPFQIHGGHRFRFQSHP